MSSFILLAGLLGKKPLNVNRSEGKPDEVIAAISAQHPGIGSTLILFSLACLMNLYPGSLISGVPASETSAMSFPSFFDNYKDGKVVTHDLNIKLQAGITKLEEEI